MTLVPRGLIMMIGHSLPLKLVTVSALAEGNTSTDLRVPVSKGCRLRRQRAYSPSPKRGKGSEKSDGDQLRSQDISSSKQTVSSVSQIVS